MIAKFQGHLAQFTERTNQSGTYADVVIRATSSSGKETLYKFSVGNSKGMVDAIREWKLGAPVLVEAGISSKQNDKGYWSTELWAYNAWRVSQPAAQETGGY